MRVEIHDVDHGSCAVVTGAGGHRLMLDCGVNLMPGRSWFPSLTYYGQRFDTLFLQNLDEDHCEDLLGMWKSCPLDAIVSNPTVTAQALRAMKAKGGMSEGVETAAALLQRFGTGLMEAGSETISAALDGRRSIMLMDWPSRTPTI